ncbi:MAG: response regulator transcription factor [Halioglobus sp.]|jgi:DNA-binding response OmpR family regulator
MNATILIIDDDRELCALLAEFLQLEGFATEAVHDGAEAVGQLQRRRYDAIVLDIMLPGLQGLEVLRRTREFSQVPILMLTARGEETDRIVGLEMGADDYLPKPCNPRELAARLRAVLRRSRGGSDGDLNAERVVGRTRINPAERSAAYGDVELALTSAEFNVLQVLLSRAGHAVDKETLSREALGRPLSAYDRSIDVHVSKIRKKLAALGGENLIVSVRGIGYQFAVGAGDNAR